MPKIEIYNPEKYTPEENAILCQLSFIQADDKNELNILKKAADDLFKHYKQEEDHSLAEVYEKRLKDIANRIENLEGVNSANNARAKASFNFSSKASDFSEQDYFDLSDWVVSSRSIVSGVNDMLTLYKPKCSFLPSDFGYFGIAHNSLDLMYNASACIKSVFYPTDHDVNLTHSERLFKQMNKGDRPYRFVGSAINIASSAINFTTSIPLVGVITSILSCVVGIVSSGMQIMKELDNYDSLLKKLEDSKKANPSSDHWDKIKKKVIAQKNEALRSHNTTLAINQCFLISTIAMLIIAPQIVVPVMVALTFISFLRRVINKELEKRAAVNTHAIRLLSPKPEEPQDNNIPASSNTFPTVK